MFLNNKYTKIYFSIIEKRKNSNSLTDVNYEKHHIIPKSLGGNNKKDNLISLTVKEHFICHLLLTKMTEGNNKTKMVWALHRMCYSENSNMNRKFTAKQYELVRKIYIKEVASKPKSEKTKEKMRKKKSKEHCENISKGRKEYCDSLNDDERKRNNISTKKWIDTISELYPNGLRHGLKHSQDSKDKISKSLIGFKHSHETVKTMKDNNTGSGNPMYGKIRITNGIENKSINLYDIIPNGWYRGMTRFNKKEGK
jgi:hypothetical protein